MARIRTIKPEIWSDPDFVERSSNARLLFVAALNFASDFGVLPDKPLQLKMQCFPGDDIAIAPLVDELVAANLWLRRTAPDGAAVLVIRTFCNHQKVDKPNGGRWGDPRTWPDSTNAPGIVDESSTNGRRTFTPGREWKGREGKGNSSSSSVVKLTKAPADAETMTKQILRTLGYAKPPPTLGERRTIQRAIDHGWTWADLEAKVAELAALAKDNPRAYVFKSLANLEQPTARGPTPPSSLVTCPDCKGESWDFAFDEKTGEQIGDLRPVDCPTCHGRRRITPSAADF